MLFLCQGLQKSNQLVFDLLKFGCQLLLGSPLESEVLLFVGEYRERFHEFKAVNVAESQ